MWSSCFRRRERSDVSSGNGSISKVGETFHTLLHFHIVCIVSPSVGPYLPCDMSFTAWAGYGRKLSTEYLFIKMLLNCQLQVQIRSQGCWSLAASGTRVEPYPLLLLRFLSKSLRHVRTLVKLANSNGVLRSRWCWKVFDCVYDDCKLSHTNSH